MWPLFYSSRNTATWPGFPYSVSNVTAGCNAAIVTRWSEWPPWPPGEAVREPRRPLPTLDRGGVALPMDGPA